MVANAGRTRMRVALVAIDEHLFNRPFRVGTVPDSLVQRKSQISLCSILLQLIMGDHYC